MTDTSKVITVGLADGRKAVSARLSEALTDVPGVACVLAADTAEAVRLVRAQSVDVILVDLHLAPAGALGPARSAAAGVARDAARDPGPAWRRSSSRPSWWPMAPGASCPATPTDRWCASASAPSMAGNTGWRATRWVRCWNTCGPSRRAGSRRSLDLLTPREHDIVRAVLRGASNGAIASDFALSPQTVRNHLSSIYLKLGVSTRLELALLVMHLQRSTR